MSFINYIRLSVEFLTKNIKQLIMLTIILAMGTMLVCMAFLLYDNYNYSEKHTNNILKYKNSGSGYFIIKNDENKEAVYKEIKENNQNVHFGFLSLTHGGIPFLNDLSIAQKKVLNSDSMGMEYIEMSPEVFELFNLNLSEGQIDIKSCKDDEMQIYVGANLDIGVWDDYKINETNVCDEFGNRIKDEDGNLTSENLRYKVCGKLKKGSEIMNPEILNTSDYISETTLNLDNLIILVRNKPLNVTNTFFYYSDNNDMNIDVNSKYYADISNGTISDVFAIMKERNKDVIKYVKQLSAILLLSVLIIQICSQVASIIINANEYGIYYANGFNKKNIIIIMIIEAIFRFIIAAMLAIIVGVVIIKYFFYEATEYEYVIKLLKGGALLKSFSISFVICFIAQIIPTIIISKIELVRLTKAEE